MNQLSIILMAVSAIFVTATAFLTGMIVGRRKEAQKRDVKYPIRDDERDASGHDTLEDEAVVYDVGKRRTEEMLARFKTLMIEQKPYLNQKVSIESLAKSLGTNKTTLSKLVNDHYGLNFRQVLNSYRVKEAMLLLSKDKTISTEELRVASGFNSISTFTSSFSRFTGCTPGEYLKKSSGR